METTSQFSFNFEERELRVDELVPNDGQVRGVPRNPRFIKDSRFEDLKRSIADTPQMLALRELLVFPLYTGKFCILAGNMRFRAARELGILKFKCKILPPKTPAVILRAIVVKDNVAFGQDDLDIIANEWDLPELRNFGFDGLPSEEELTGALDEKDEDKRKDFGDREGSGDDENGEASGGDDAKKDDDEIFAAHIADTMFPTDNEFGIPVLDVDRQPKTFPEAPFVAFGERRGWLTEAHTLHFYIDDFRFNRVWRDPSLILGGSIAAFVEPNFSLYSSMPRAYAYFATFKKRWLSRFWQDCGLLPFVDLNVNPLHKDINHLGIPKGWRAFAARGYSGMRYGDMDSTLKEAFEFTEKPMLVVYSGGKDVKEWCEKNSQYCLYVQDFHNELVAR